MKKIVLEEKLLKNSKLLSGRPYGIRARENFKIEEKDKAEENYLVIINEDKIEAIAPSFLLGLFSKSIKILGVDQFLKKYNFKNQNGDEVDDDFKEDLQEAIDWALREKDPME